MFAITASGSPIPSTSRSTLIETEVVIDQRTCLTFVGVYSLADHTLHIVWTLNRSAAVNIANARLDWRVVDQIVDVSTHFTNPSVRQTAYQLVLPHNHIQHNGGFGFVKGKFLQSPRLP